MAAYIPENQIEKVKAAADIVELVSEVVQLRKTGKDYIGLCPFHSEKTPSFTVSPDKQIFYCFGCGAGGNVFGFLMQMENLSFPQAVRLLARRYSIEIPDESLSPQQRRELDEREELAAINQRAADFYARILRKQPQGEPARNYLKKRGITAQTARVFGLGYAPAGWDHLLRSLYQARISPALAQKAGLVIPRKDGRGYYDRFRDRIVFPIRDIRGQVLAFGGRAIADDSQPKYLNSPESPIYHKGKTLYGLHLTRGACREQGTVYLVEGYMDLIALWHHGIQNGAATLGTALTTAQLRLLKGYAQQVFLVFDSDAAGIRAAQRSLPLFRKEGLAVRVLILPQGQDPFDYLFGHGREAFLGAGEKAPDAMEFLADCAIRQHGSSPEGKLRVLSELKPVFNAMADPVGKALHVQALARQLEINEGLIWESLGKAPASANATPLAQNLPPKAWQEEQIVAMMVAFPDMVPEVRERKLLALFQDRELRSLGELLLRQGGRAPSDLMDQADNPRQRSRLAALATRDGEVWEKTDCFELIKRFESARRSRRERRRLTQKIKAVQAEGDQELAFKLLREKQKQLQAKGTARKNLNAGGENR